MFSWRFFMKKKLHGSVFIAHFSVGLILGVVSGLVITTSFASFSWLVITITLVMTSFIFKRAWMLGLVLTAGITFGLWRAGQEQVGLLAYKNYYSKTVDISGKVSEDVALGKNNKIQIELEGVQINNKKVSGKVWLSTNTYKRLQRSDKINATGTLKPGFGSFAASMSFAKIENVHKGADEARDVRDWFAAQARKTIDEPETSLGVGFLVGQRSSLPEELDQQLQVVGLTHIVVASGYNLTVLVRLSRRLFAGISKYLTALSGSLLISGFILITGFSPSMSRAGLVAGLSLAAWYYGRKISPFVLLPLVAATTLVINPSFARGDVGWYLSFAAFGGVMVLAPLLQHYFFGKTKPNFIRQVLGETLAALLMTAPIIMVVFGHYSPYAVLANVLVVPLIPYIMLAVFIGGLASAWLPLLALYINVPGNILLHYVTAVTNWIASLPDAQTEATIGLNGMIAYYLFIIVAGYYMWRKTKHSFREDNLVE